jgi:hypothetical protein
MATSKKSAFPIFPNHGSNIITAPLWLRTKGEGIGCIMVERSFQRDFPVVAQFFPSFDRGGILPVDGGWIEW